MKAPFRRTPRCQPGIGAAAAAGVPVGIRLTDWEVAALGGWRLAADTACRREKGPLPDQASDSIDVARTMCRTGFDNRDGSERGRWQVQGLSGGWGVIVVEEGGWAASPGLGDA
jgi:hypothetical protein